MAAADQICIHQIEFHGHCGVTDAEREAGQRLSVDLFLTCDLRPAAASDRLQETIDYDRLAMRIVQLGRRMRVRLLETLAEQIADAALEDSRVRSVCVRLKKPLPPSEEIRSGVVIEITRAAKKNASG